MDPLKFRRCAPRIGLLMLAVAACLSFPVLAQSTVSPVSITYSELRMVVDGRTIVPKDANGNPAEPFMYQNTTYLPLRALANALHLDVAWDPATSAIRLTSDASISAEAGNPPLNRGTRKISAEMQTPNLILNGQALTLKNQDGTPAKAIVYADTTYLPLRALANALGQPVEWDADSHTIYIGQQVTYRLTRESTQTMTANGVSSTTEYSYNEDNQLTNVMTMNQDGRQTITSYTYDEDGACLTSSYTGQRDTTSTTRYSYTYDKNGNPTKAVATDAVGNQTVTTRTYDQKGNCISEIVRFANGDEESYGRTYDTAGRLLSQRHVTGLKTETDTYTYNNYGQVETHVYALSNGLTLTTSYTYNENGQAVSSLMSTGSGAALETVYTYDENGNRISAVNEQTETRYFYQEVPLN